MKNKKRKIENLLLLIAGGIFIGCATWLWTVYSGYKASSDEYQELYENMVKAVADVENQQGFENGNGAGNTTSGGAESGSGHADPAEDYVMLEIDFEALREINPDVVGWIDLPGLGISYPVVQAEDNQYYLNRTFRNETNLAGSIYMDFRNRADMSDRNTIIHGHNMKNRTMFGNLKEYGEAEVAEANREFYFYTPEKVYRCEVIACRTVSAVMEQYPTGFETEEAFMEFTRKAVRGSWHDFGVGVGKNDRLITLSTCTSSDTSRFVVQARVVEVE